MPGSSLDPFVGLEAVTPLSPWADDDWVTTTMVALAMADGTRLATEPKVPSGSGPVVTLRLPNSESFRRRSPRGLSVPWPFPVGRGPGPKAILGDSTKYHADKGETVEI